MSFDQFSRDQYVRVIETNETATMGSYTIAESIELDQILLWLNVEGTPGGAETMQVLVYGSGLTDTPLYSSEIVALADIDFAFDPGLGNWIGEVPFNFDRESLGANQTYFISLKMTGYTRNADAYYIGYVFDNPEPIYSRIVPNETAAKAIIVGFE